MGKESLRDRADKIKKNTKPKPAPIDLSLPYETTPAQRIMRSEMEAGVHKPEKLGDVLKSEFGEATSAEQPVTDLAYEIINEHGEGLKLGLREWQIVQNMVEAGIVAGRG